jgi:hypothetical protein
MSFKQTEVAARFEMTGADQDIKTGSYSGPLSNAPLAVIQGMIERKSNLVKPKPAGAPPKQTEKA